MSTPNVNANYLDDEGDEDYPEYDDDVNTLSSMEGDDNEDS